MIVDGDLATQRFADALALYDLRAAGARELVDRASDLVANGHEGDGVLQLACQVITPLTSLFEIDALVVEARRELQLPPLDAASLRLRATQAQVRRWLAGQLSDRQLASWAHSAVGHGHQGALEELVATDDRFDLAEGGYEPPGAGLRSFAQVADSVLILPDPWVS